MAVFDPFDPLKHITPRFTEQQLSEIIEFFDKHAKSFTLDDGNSINVISIETFIQFLELKKFHRRHFSYPSYKEIMAEVEFLKAGETRALTKEQVIYILDKRIIEAEIKHELLLAFQLFDTENRKFLELGELEAIATSYGDVFTAEETRELLRDANVRGDGNIVYEDFIENLFNMAPELYDIKADFLYTDPEEDPSVPPEPEVPPEEVAPPPLPPPPPPPAKPAKGKKK